MPTVVKSISPSAEAVLENLKRRREEIHNNVSSDIVTGLVIQGGGMRAIYAAGAACALHKAGFGNAFDHVLGASAGAIHGAYYLSDRPDLPIAAYLDDLSGPPFIDYWRWNMILDVDFLVDEVMKKRKPLDEAKLRESHAKFHIVMTDCDRGVPDIVTNRDPNFEPYEALRASSALPIIYDKPVSYNGRRYIDGGITDYVPVVRALDAGCNNLVVIITRPLGWRRNQPGFVKRLFRRVLFRKYPEATIRILQSEDKLFNRTMEILEGEADLGKNINIVTVFPTNRDEMVSRVTTDRIRLERCSELGKDDMRTALNLPRN